MGQVGRWIDGRIDRQKDRLVTAQNWCWMRNQDFDNNRCLVYHAIDACNDFAGWDATEARDVALRFDQLCSRFGIDRIVRAVKLRAGASLEDLRSPQTTEPREPVEAGR